MIRRTLQEQLKQRAQYYSVIAIIGPRQSGKTTLAQQTFTQHRYVSLENPNNRQFAASDPEHFLTTYQSDAGTIIDEFQYVPELLSYIQTRVDALQQPGFYILTGSQHFLMSEAISQSLAGRVSITTLLPLSIHELSQEGLLPKAVGQAIYNGFYPSIYAKGVPPALWYADYTQTYIERDVRQLAYVQDLRIFQIFIQMCAARTGQLLNLSSLAQDCGISDVTAKRWLHLLEASFIIFLVQPYHNNFGKRLTKSPKLYFYDVGLVCSLLGITSGQITTHAMRGQLFETMIMSDCYKQYYNYGMRPTIYFWRDHVGNEIDMLIERGMHVMPVEIKAGYTITNDYFKGLQKFVDLAGDKVQQPMLVYAGDESQQRADGLVVPWYRLDTINLVR